MGWALGCGDFARDVGGSLFCFCFAFLGCNWLFWAVAFPSFLGRFCLFFCFLGLGLLYSLVVLLRLLEINAYLSKKKIMIMVRGWNIKTHYILEVGNGFLLDSLRVFNPAPIR